MQQLDKSRYPSEAEYEEVQRGYSILDDYSPDMCAVKAYANEQRIARVTAAVTRESPPHDPYNDCFLTLFRAHDEENQRRIDEQCTSHFLQGASHDNHYQINGAGAPFERLFFQARDQLRKVTEDLAFERKDRAYEQECHAEWEDFDCIDALLAAEKKLRRAREDLEEAQFQIRELCGRIQQLKESSV